MERDKEIIMQLDASAAAAESPVVVKTFQDDPDPSFVFASLRIKAINC